MYNSPVVPPPKAGLFGPGESPHEAGFVEAPMGREKRDGKVVCDDSRGAAAQLSPHEAGFVGAPIKDGGSQ